MGEREGALKSNSNYYDKLTYFTVYFRVIKIIKHDSEGDKNSLPF